MSALLEAVGIHTGGLVFQGQMGSITRGRADPRGGAQIG